MAKTRVTIVAGFLGAGKTSVIRHLLRDQPSPGQTAVLVNEIGEVGIDGDLITAESGDACLVREMAGACICCTANSPFRQAIVELLRRKNQLSSLSSRPVLPLLTVCGKYLKIPNQHTC